MSIQQVFGKGFHTGYGAGFNQAASSYPSIFDSGYGSGYNTALTHAGAGVAIAAGVVLVTWGVLVVIDEHNHSSLVNQWLGSSDKELMREMLRAWNGKDLDTAVLHLEKMMVEKKDNDLWRFQHMTGCQASTLYHLNNRHPEVVKVVEAAGTGAIDKMASSLTKTMCRLSNRYRW